MLLQQGSYTGGLSRQLHIRHHVQPGTDRWGLSANPNTKLSEGCGVQPDRQAGRQAGRQHSLAGLQALGHQGGEQQSMCRAQVAMERSLGLQPAPFMEAKDEAGGHGWHWLPLKHWALPL